MDTKTNSKPPPSFAVDLSPRTRIRSTLAFLARGLSKEHPDWSAALEVLEPVISEVRQLALAEAVARVRR